MATNRVRLTTYVDPATAALVKDAAAALDQTSSALLADVISYGVPMLEMLRDMALTIKGAPDQARAAVEQMAVTLRPLADQIMREMDALEAAGGPPPSNRGGTFRNV